MKTGHYVSGLRLGRLVGLAACGLLATGHVAVRAQTQQASGGGTYLVLPGVRSEFQFDQAHVQCKIGHTVMDDGTVFQMFMFSTSVDSVTIDSAAKTVTITGSMVSIVNLRFPDGTTANLSETVPYVAYGKDGGTPGAGAAFFSLKVVYKDTPGLDQFDLFGSPATFAGTVVAGDVTIR